MMSTCNVPSTTTRNVDTTMGITITIIDIISSVNSIVLPRTNLYQLQRKILQLTRTAMLETEILIAGTYFDLLFRDYNYDTIIVIMTYLRSFVTIH
ncbi:hypothetical protein RRG08_056383 [Elysia crispata]|uniref:Uncharacterized protein n=1 Tax=Elysia crispata TaxID=231223 RepID=A0AAE1DEH3_9GAST|nr:hypothetical protein RRG08_056383 [Elysia crispata]